MGPRELIMEPLVYDLAPGRRQERSEALSG